MSLRRKVLGTLPVIAVFAALGAVVFAVGGSTTAGSVKHQDPLVIEEIEGSDVKRLTLEPRAVERLGIQTVVVRRRGGHLVVPDGAVMVDAYGDYWVYTNPEPLVYLRAPVVLDRYAGTRALLLEGPAAGTRIVTAGAAELFGAEFGIGK